MHPFSLIFHWDTTKDDEEMGQSLGHWQWAESLEVQIGGRNPISLKDSNTLRKSNMAIICKCWISTINDAFPNFCLNMIASPAPN